MATHIEDGYLALQAFATCMTKAQQVSDGLLTARVIGEFSAGKTRFLREVLGDSIPPVLYPVSSLERQTRLPLEITYGPEPKLTLVQRANDYEINERTLTLQTLTEFPEREATLQHDPLRHRLRLAVPESRLILKEGDGYSDDKSAKRLFLIDMPGWNSGDDFLAEGDASEIMTGFHNLALIYVVSAIRLDGLKNSERLKNFLQAFSEADFVGEPHLIVIMTHCPTTEASALDAKVRNQVGTLWNELGETSSLKIDLFSIDFEEVSTAHLVIFRNKFWQSLLSPLGQTTQAFTQHPWVHSLRSWPEKWTLNEPIAQTQLLLAQARAVLRAAFQENSYLLGMNMTKLSGLDATAIQERLQNTWSRQMRDTASATDQSMSQRIPLLEINHPLADWWNRYWVQNLQITLQPVTDFLDKVSIALEQVTPKTSNLQTHLSQQLDPLYQEAVQATNSSFTLVADILRNLPQDTPPEKILATLLHLSLLQMRYQDHFEGRT